MNHARSKHTSTAIRVICVKAETSRAFNPTSDLFISLLLLSPQKMCFYESLPFGRDESGGCVCEFHGCLSLEVIMFQLWPPEMLNRTENR